jgi:aspartate aminotransferase
MFLIQLVYYGDLAIPTPSWVTYAPQAQIIGRHVRWLNTHRTKNWKLQPAELEELCRDDPDRPRLVILNYPNNPTGYAYTVDTLKELADVARRYRVVMLSDEIYAEIHHDGRHNSMAEFYPEGTIISSGLSKWCGAGGWRLGTFTFPDNLAWLQQSVAVVASETFTSTSAPIQFAAVRAFEGGQEIESYLFQCRRVLRALGRCCFERLQKVGIELTPPDGAFYLFPDFGAFKPALREAGISTSAALCQKLLEDMGVATLPGSAFGRRPAELTLRMAYVDFDGTAALIAASGTPPDQTIDERFLKEHCRPVIEAVDRICDWVSAL